MYKKRNAYINFLNIGGKMMREFKGQSLWTYPKDYVVIDIETNGFLSHICEILEISAVKFRNGEKVATFSTLIKPKGKVHPFITKLTGITTNIAQTGIDIVPALISLKEFVRDDILMGYNVNFDINFLYDNMIYYLNTPLSNDYVDILRFARKFLPHLYNHKQTTVASHLGIDIVGAHRAEKDCLICNAIYQKLSHSGMLDIEEKI